MCGWLLLNDPFPRPMTQPPFTYPCMHAQSSQSQNQAAPPSTSPVGWGRPASPACCLPRAPTHAPGAYFGFWGVCLGRRGYVHSCVIAFVSSEHNTTHVPTRLNTPNDSTQNGSTPLHTCVSHRGTPEIARMLLDYAPPTQTKRCGLSYGLVGFDVPIRVLTCRRHRLLPVSCPPRLPPTHTPTSQMQPAQPQTHKHRNSNDSPPHPQQRWSTPHVDDASLDGTTPLHIAARRGSLEMVRFTGRARVDCLLVVGDRLRVY